MATLLLNKAHYPVTVLGPGKRIGLWLQGCSIRCKGCVSRDTWPADGGRRIEVAALIDWCRLMAQGGCDGVTISGGEPFDQPKALAALLDGLCAWRRLDGADFDLLVYSGYPAKTLRARHGKLLGKIDALIAEPYIDALPMDKLWRGSRNQTLLPLTELGRQRYAPYLDAPAEEGKRIQVAVDQGRLWLIGLPGRGDMARLEALCQSRGLRLDQTSWR